MSGREYLSQPHEEGTFQIDDYELYYRRFGTGDDVVVALHGGPGMPHDYLLPLAEHGTADRSVYLYDQFGVGRSDGPAPGDFDRYTVEHYREEVEAIRQRLDPDTFTLYGQSWGGMLALEYAIEYTDALDRLILANTLADTQSAFESMRDVLSELPESAQSRIEAKEAARQFDDPEYEEVLDEAYREHVCRVHPYPAPVERTFENINMDSYGIMWGPNEYVLLDEARLADWDVRESLPDIDVPTLVITSEYDEIEPGIARDIADRLPDSTLVEFEDASHMPFWERPEAHKEAVESFLSGK